MPSSLIIVALVVAWLVVLVPMVVRRRQEIARTADSELAARVVRSGSAEDVREEDDGDAGGRDTEAAMREAEDIRDDFTDQIDEESEDETDRVHDTELVHEPRARPDVSEDGYDMGYADEEFAEPYPSSRPFRPGRGGFDPEAAAVLARVRYAFRQRVVLGMLIGALVSGVLAGAVFPVLWWAHGVLDVLLVSYLGYLRRQVRIEQEIRERRLARMRATRRASARPHEAPAAPAAVPSDVAFEEAEEDDADYQEEEPARREPVSELPRPLPPPVRHPNAVVVDVDDEDPAFDELAEPGEHPYRRAVGE